MAIDRVMLMVDEDAAAAVGHRIGEVEAGRLVGRVVQGLMIVMTILVAGIMMMVEEVEAVRVATETKVAMVAMAVM